jgi:argininosuccinate lyase
MDTTLACLEVAAVCVRGAKYDPQACEAACAGGHLDATDLADLLVAKGVPFRDAHERIGILVRAADQEGVGLSQLPPALSQEHLPELASSDLTEELSLTRILERRCVLGGTAPSRVRAAIDTWKTRLKSWNN